MATLVLTTVGTAIGGPIGGAIGALIGQQADNVLFAPKARQGPRLGDLAVQTSSYGTQIPKIFGTMRVAGTVIWATDLKERRSTSGGGKGQPKSVSYSYSASFAVALSGRAITRVRRIWADGKLLRGAAGDFKSRTKYRLYKGSEDQPVDPAIASAEGVGQAPAFRGIAYAVFEDFELADYGNRIPSLSFEIVAEDLPVPIGRVAAELSGEELKDNGTSSLAGYAASGNSVRGALEVISNVVPLSLEEVEGRLRIGPAAGSPIFIAETQTGARRGDGSGRSEVMRRALSSVPGEVSLAYHDMTRDYQTGMQRAASGGGGLAGERLALPAVLDPDAAKSIAEHRLAWLRTARATAKVHLAWRDASIRPAALVRLQHQAGLWKVERWTLDRMVTTLDLVGVPGGGAPAASGSAGRPVSQADEPVGPTTLRLFDLPSLTDTAADKPRLLVAAASAGSGWRRAALSVSYDGGASWTDAGETAGPAVIGHTLSALAPGGSTLIDVRSSVEVQLLNEAMWLEGRTDAALAGGANLAVIGDELIQFGQVEALGSRRFRLSRLLRGRRGSEWAASAHIAGEAFVLLEAENVAVLDPSAAMIGGEARLLAVGLGDGPDGVGVQRAIAGEAVRPPTPAHLRAETLANEDIAISWVRRSRSGWSWLSGSDTPLGEEVEAYNLVLSGGGFERRLTLNEPHHVYTKSEQMADGVARPLTIAVTQLGTLGTSRPAEIIIDQET